MSSVMHLLCEDVSQIEAAREETRLATISAPGTDFFSKKHKNEVPHLLNRNYGEISNKTFSLGQSQ
jgi:hypothetical protein